MLRTTFAALAVCVLVAGCAASTTPAPASSAESAPMPGRVTDLEAFGSFIATRPTVDQFHARYPDVTLVQPGEVATKEFRTDNSRYFAKVDVEGRIVGGSFQ